LVEDKEEAEDVPDLLVRVIGQPQLVEHALLSHLFLL